MKKIILTFLVISIYWATNAQVGVNLLDSPIQKKDSGLFSNTRVSLSSNFFVMGNKQHQFYGSSLTPSISFSNDKRFSYGFGTRISSFHTENTLNSEMTKQTPQTYFQNSLFVFGSYRATEKLQISGFLYQDMPLKNNLNQETSPFFQSNKGIYVDFNYKINEKTFFQIGFDYNQGNSPFKRSTGFSNGYHPTFFTP